MECLIFFQNFLSLLDRAEPLLRTPRVGHTCVCNSLHASFAVCGSSVKQVSYSWHIVLDTDTLYTFLNFINQFISLLNLHLESELIIVNIDFENLQSVYRSLEIHNCALTSSLLRPPSSLLLLGRCLVFEMCSPLPSSPPSLLPSPVSTTFSTVHKRKKKKLTFKSAFFFFISSIFSFHVATVFQISLYFASFLFDFGQQHHPTEGGNQAAPPNRRGEKCSSTQRRKRKATPRKGEGKTATPPKGGKLSSTQGECSSAKWRGRKAAPRKRKKQRNTTRVDQAAPPNRRGEKSTTNQRKGKESNTTQRRRKPSSITQLKRGKESSTTPMEGKEGNTTTKER